MRKLLSLLLVFIIVFFAVGCSANEKGLKNFSDIEEFENYSNNFWVCKGRASDSISYYRIYFFNDNDKICHKYYFSYSSSETLSDCLKNIIDYNQEKFNESFKDMIEFLVGAVASEGLSSDEFDIQYDLNSSQIITSNRDPVGSFLKNGAFRPYNSDDEYYQDNNLSDLSEAFVEANNSIFTSKYGDLPTYKDVKYDPASYLTKNFLLSGSAELDDYYNYDYRDLEFLYFCVCVTPHGGGFTDSWYIYCRRDKYENLLEKLKKGPISSINMVCCGSYYNSLPNEMANLVDYYYTY